MKVGDVVQLKSGGPNMTIEGFIMEEDAKKINQGYKLFMEMRKKQTEENCTYVFCKWFDNKNTYLKEIFLKESLKVVD